MLARPLAMTWLDLALLTADLALVLVLLTSRSRRLWPLARRAAFVLLQVAGVFALTWLIVAAASASSAHASSGSAAAQLNPIDTALLAHPPAFVISNALRLSLLVMALAAAAAAWAGLAGAVAVVSAARRRLVLLSPAATVLWVLPTFLIAILVQELQALIFGLSGMRVAAGFGEVNSVQIFWVSLILAVRPTAYFFHQARAALDLDITTEYVRTARAKGLSWQDVVSRHIVRANAARIATAWLNAFRTMIGSLPLVEFLFGYPGLGRVLVLALGLSYSGGVGPIHADIAIGLVSALALVLIVVEGLLGWLEQRLDPRLRPLRLGLPA
jgi:ABC-type dipeptide/oligopeptide/nickel transport system permease component